MKTRDGIVLFLVVSAWLTAARPAPAQRFGGADQDLVFFEKSRPYLVRLHLHVDGRPYQASWEVSLATLFRFLDANRDGVLSAAELAHAPSPTQFLQIVQGSTEVEPDAAPAWADVAGGTGGAVTPEKFKAYYCKNQAAPLQVAWGQRRQKTDGLTDALLAALDVNRDGQLSREELRSAPAALARFDTNNDEMVSADELAPQSGFEPIHFNSTIEDGPVPEKLPFAVVDPDGPDVHLARRLLAHYDKDHDGKLGPTELGLDPAALARLDTNRDGALDAGELSYWSLQAPDLELIVQLGDTPFPRLALVPAAEGSAAVGPVHQSHYGALLAELPGLLLEIAAGEGVLGGRRAQRKYLEDTFKALDVNHDGFLDSKEVHRPPSFGLVAYLRLADRDGDGRISAREWTDYLDVHEKLITQATLLTWVDRGPSLFELLDANHDGKLSLRELRDAWMRLAPWAGGNDRLGRRQLPRQYQLLLSFGMHGKRGMSPSGQSSGKFTPDAVLVAPPRLRGPLWFRKMDRNGDGDLSPREFLGTLDQFRLIDTDGNGLIDSEEAVRADAWFRGRKR